MKMLAEFFWQIMEGFVEFSVNLLAELMRCGRNVPNDDLLFAQASTMWILDKNSHGHLCKTILFSMKYSWNTGTMKLTNCSTHNMDSMVSKFPQ